jgi:hypothetical protein
LKHDKKDLNGFGNREHNDDNGRRRWPKAAAAGTLGWLGAGLSLLLILAIPLAILVVGAPVALAVRLLIEISRRWL